MIQVTVFLSSWGVFSKLWASEGVLMRRSSGMASRALKVEPAFRLGSNCGTPSLFGFSSFEFGLKDTGYVAT